MLFGSLFGLSLVLVVSIGSLAGYQEGMRSQQSAATELAEASVQQQYDLAVQELAQGSYDTARQRLEYVIAANPGFPGAADRLAEAQVILFSTATPTPPPATLTPTPTRDFRPVQELMAKAEQLWNDQKWDEAIDTLLALRANDPAYQTARVDGMLYMALRQRGNLKIWSQGLLEGGMYDLALASRFGPLDVQSLSSRDLARLYLTGSGFYEVYPEEAVKYFSQVAAAAPGMRDASGVSAVERYFQSLIQYGDKLLNEKSPCEALEQYELASGLGRGDAELETKRQAAYNGCYPPTRTPGPTQAATIEASSTPAGEATSTPALPPSSTPPAPPPSSTPAPPTNTSVPPTNTSAPPPSDTPAPPPSDTPVPPPVDTDAPQPPDPSPSTNGEG